MTRIRKVFSPSPCFFSWLCALAALGLGACTETPVFQHDAAVEQPDRGTMVQVHLPAGQQAAQPGAATVPPVRVRPVDGGGAAVSTGLAGHKPPAEAGAPPGGRIITGPDPLFADGKRTPEQVLATVRTRLSALRDCVTAAQKRGGKAGGKVVIEFVVAPDGRVVRTGARSDTSGDDQLAPCLQKEFEAMVFPASPGEDMTYSFPFVLRAPR